MSAASPISSLLYAERQRADGNVRQTLDDLLFVTVQDPGRAQALLAKPGDYFARDLTAATAVPLGDVHSVSSPAVQKVAGSIPGGDPATEPAFRGSNPDRALDVNGKVAGSSPVRGAARDRAIGGKGYKVSFGSTGGSASDLKVMSLASLDALGQPLTRGLLTSRYRAPATNGGGEGRSPRRPQGSREPEFQGSAQPILPKGARVSLVESQEVGTGKTKHCRPWVRIDPVVVNRGDEVDRERRVLLDVRVHDEARDELCDGPRGDRAYGAWRDVRDERAIASQSHLDVFNRVAVVRSVEISDRQRDGDGLPWSNDGLSGSSADEHAARREGEKTTQHPAVSPTDFLHPPFPLFPGHRAEGAERGVLLITRRGIVAAVILGYCFGPSHAATVRRPQDDYTKTTVSFDKTAVDLSYGQTTTMCATVKGPLKGFITFDSEPPSALAVQETLVPGCTSRGLSVQARLSDCTSAQGKVVPKFKGKVFKKKFSLVTIVRPTKDVAVFFENHTCAEGGFSPPGGIVDWTITFSGNKPANFDGLMANETLASVPRGPDDPMSCDIPVPTPGGRRIGEVGPNQVPDNLGTCDQYHLTLDCQSVFLQTVKVGECVVQTNKLYFIFSNDGFFTKREDPKGATPVASPPIPQ